jgi:all-trans-nonaprenyl-diphosphate synthase
MANSLRAVPVLLNIEGEQEVCCFRVGQHFGIAFQIIDDILDYISTSEEMGKEELADIIQGNVTAPIYFNLYHEIISGSTKDKFMLS